ncbi:MAG: MTH1187 family thiamine-binding protein [Candidatus Thiodiazotropha sp.]
MSVLLEFSIFPLDQGESVSAHVSQVVRLIRDSGVDYQLTAMGTLIETDDIDRAMDLVKRASELLEQRGCRRVYATLKLDIRSGPQGRLQSKTRSIKTRIGEVSTGRETEDDNGHG